MGDGRQILGRLGFRHMRTMPKQNRLDFRHLTKSF